MMKKVLFLLSIMLCGAPSAFAYSFSAVAPSGQTLYYNINNDGTSVCVTYPGNDYNNPYSGFTTPTGALTIPSTVSNDGSTYNVTIISSRAFGSCSGLISVTIPNSVIDVAGGAFYGCSGLTTVNFNADSCINMGDKYDPVFANCTNLTTVNIGNTVKAIPYSAFYGCTGLTTVNFNADSCTFMSDASYPVFENCNNLSTVNIGNNVKIIPDEAFYDCHGLTTVTIGNSVSRIGHYAFGGCGSLTYTNYTGTAAQWAAIDISSNPVVGSHNLYLNDTLLTDLVFPDTTTVINSNFRYDTALHTITIPNSVTRIDGDAFDFCSGLTSITIPNSVTHIGRNAFSHCSGLTTINFNADSCTYMGGAYEYDAAFYCSGNLAVVNIGNNVKVIPDFAFCSCRESSVTIGDSVSRIGKYAFYDCNRLTMVSIPNSVTSIGEYAFGDCVRMTNISLGSGLQRIGAHAFEECTQMVRIKSFATTAPTVESSTFSDLSNDVIINVPCGYASSYENAAYWHRFDIQEELMYEFTVAPNDPSRGTVQILNAPSCDNYEAQIQANAYHNYHFARWSDGDTDNPRYIVVMQDVNLEAIFLAEGETEGIDDVEEGALRVWANNGHIYVATDNAAGAETSVEVYDMKGCKVATMATDEESPLLPKGVYLVKVGTLAAKKVVVF